MTDPAADAAEKTPTIPAPTGEAAPVLTPAEVDAVIQAVALAPEPKREQSNKLVDAVMAAVVPSPAPTFPDGAPIPAEAVAAAEALPKGVPISDEDFRKTQLGAAFDAPLAAAPTSGNAPAARMCAEIPAPTIGRIVLHRGKDQQIRPAIVTHVWGVFCINLFVFPKDSSDTEAGPKTSVTHADPEQEPACFPSWHWMPYQLGQAAKTAEAEAKAAAPAGGVPALESLAGELARLRGQVERALSDAGYPLI